MRDSEISAKSNGKRSRHEADSNSVQSSNTNNNCKDETGRKQNLKRAKMSRSMGASNTKTNKAGSNDQLSPKFKTSVRGSRKGDKKSPELRPRRRASQTYFFKYQLAKNPLKAEEEDLRLALLASLQQCGNGSDDNQKLSSKKLSNSPNGAKNSVRSPTSASKKSAARSLDNSSPSHSSTSSFSLLSNTANEITRVQGKETKNTSKKAPAYKINGSNSNNAKRRGSVESSSSSIGSSLKEGSKKKPPKSISLLANLHPGPHPKTQGKSSHTTSSSDFTSVQNRIKKAKKVLQNKKANESKRSNIISKYSALRKFPSNSSTAAITNRSTSLLSPARKAKNGGKVNNFYCNNLSTANYNNTTSGNQSFVPYSPYAPIQKKDPPDEEYLKKYKPETEDFLTFICFRSTVPNYQNRLNETIKIETEDSSSTTIIDCSSPSKTPEKKSPNSNHNTNDSQLSKHSSNLSQNNNKNTTNNNNNINSSPSIHVETDSPVNQQRRPTRQSPRLASWNRKISENDSSNLTIITSNAMHDNSVTYEEDMKRASMALEDMAHEINSSDGMKNEPSSNGLESSRSFSCYKNSKHLVKSLMTREFAGGFADEETIFESISNHIL